MRTHLYLPLVSFVAAALVFEMSTLDLRLADFIYVLSGNDWVMRDAWVTRELIHDGGRLLVGVMASVLLLATAASNLVASLKPYRRGLAYLCASVMVCGLAINLLKELTHVDCPWDLVRYGGELPYVRNFAVHPRSFRYGACFPAGHASAAYAWLGIYYFAREYVPRWKSAALIAVLVMGSIFGAGQQLRGAHFLSHDVWTLGLCWLLASGLYMLFFRGGFQPARAP